MTSKNSLSHTILSVLDLMLYSSDRSIAETYQAAADLAKHVEHLGYHRYLIAEHHNLNGVASSATSVLIGYIAQHTSRIRVGAGGIMLPNHSSLHVAEEFGTLETLYPGRIDLGLGRASGADQLTTMALRGSSHEMDFETQIDELLFYFSPVEPGQRLRAIPGAGLNIPIIILGSSLYSAKLAAALGRPYAFAGHFAPEEMRQAFDIYRSEFRPSAVLKQPYIAAGIQIIAAEDDETAEYLATTIYQRFLSMVRRIPLDSIKPVRSMEGIWSKSEESLVKRRLATAIFGGKETVTKKLNQFVEDYQVDELIVTSDAFNITARKTSYEILMDIKRSQA